MLLDSMRVCIVKVSRLCHQHDLSGWRTFSYNVRRLKSHCHKAQRSCRFRGADAEKRKHKAHNIYLSAVDKSFTKVQGSVQQLQEVVAPKLSVGAYTKLQEKLVKIEVYQSYAEKLREQIRRRVLEDVTITHNEKIFSVFQPHTEWISKGKAGVPVELGLKVCVLEDQYQFIIHHHVMVKQQDVEVAASMVAQAQQHFPSLRSCSFDKGFHSPANQIKLATLLDHAVLPKKGRMTIKEKIKTNEPNYKQARRQHSAVESAINALEQHGLDRCPDHGIDSFKRYAALSVLARNLQIIGVLLTQKESKELQRKRQRMPHSQTA